MREIGRSKVSTRFQVVIPENVRSLLKMKDLEKDSECYIYFIEENGDVKIKVAIVETEEKVIFIE